MPAAQLQWLTSSPTERWPTRAETRVMAKPAWAHSLTGDAGLLTRGLHKRCERADARGEARGASGGLHRTGEQSPLQQHLAQRPEASGGLGIEGVRGDLRRDAVGGEGPRLVIDRGDVVVLQVDAPEAGKMRARSGKMCARSGKMCARSGKMCARSGQGDGRSGEWPAARPRDLALRAFSCRAGRFLATAGPRRSVMERRRAGARRRVFSRGLSPGEAGARRSGGIEGAANDM